MEIRRAVAEDADAIAAIHVAGWRETYAGILPAAHLAALSVERRAGDLAPADRGRRRRRASPTVPASPR